MFFISDKKSPKTLFVFLSHPYDSNYNDMKFLTCLIFIFLQCLPLAAQDDPPFWRKPVIQAKDMIYPVIRFTPDHSGVWLPAQDAVVVSLELLDRHTINADNKVPELRGAIIGRQQSLPDNLDKLRARQIRDSLTQVLATGPGDLVVWRESVSGLASDVMLLEELEDWEVLKRSPRYGIAILYSPELAGYTARVKPENPKNEWSGRDTLHVVGLPQVSHFNDPPPLRRHHWLRERPFRDRILDSLGQDEEGVIARQQYLYDPSDPLYSLYLEQWPYQRTVLLIDALSNYGHPWFAVSGLLRGMIKQGESGQSNPAYIRAIHKSLSDIYRTTVAEQTEEKLAKSLQLYFAETPGKLIPPILTEAARFHQKDYHRLARTIQAKSRLSDPGQWLSELQETPVATIDHMKTDYGFVLLDNILHSTLKGASREYETTNQKLQEREAVFHRKERPIASGRQANGSLRISSIIMVSGIPVQGTIAPGMSGAAVLNRDGAPAGLLLPCIEDMAWGAWHPETDLRCTRFVSLADVMAVLKE